MYTAGVTASAHADPRSGQGNAIVGVLSVCCSRGASNLPAGDYFRPAVGPARLHTHSSARPANPGLGADPALGPGVADGSRRLGHSPWHSHVTRKPVVPGDS